MKEYTSFCQFRGTIFRFLLLLILPTVSGLSGLAQNRIDIGIYEAASPANTIEVKVKPNFLITADQAISGIMYTIRWTDPTITITTVNAVSPFSVAKQGGVVFSNGYYHQIFGAVPVAAVGADIPAGSEVKISSFVFSGGACSIIDINNDAWTNANNGDVYLELGGNDLTGIIYRAQADLGSIGGTVSGGAGTINLGQTTGTITLEGYSGSILGWQKRVNTGTWTDIGSSSGLTTYSETPSSVGVWDYRSKIQRGSCTIAYSTFVSVTVNQATTSWTGSFSSDWFNAANWSNGVPDAAKDAVIPVVAPNPYPVIAGNTTLPNLTIALAANLTINPQASLTVSGTLTNNAGTDGLIVKSTAAGTGSIITNTGSVPATIERYLTGSSPYTSSVWHLISSPVSGQSIPGLVGANPFALNGIKYGLAPYDNSIPSWVPYTTTSLAGAGNFTVGKGYEAMLTANTSLAFKGTLTVANTPSPVAVGSNSWNLVGNPFSAPICANVPADGVNNFITVNAGILPIDYQAVYLWDPTLNGYKTINNTSAATYVQVGQGFFIRAASSGSASITAAMRTVSLAPFYKNTESNWPLIDLKAAIGDKNRSTQVFFIPGTTEGVDAGYDAGIIDAFTMDKAIYTNLQGSNVGFAIQSLPSHGYENRVIPVGLNAPQGSEVTFTAAITDMPAGTKVYLEDRLRGLFIRLDEAGSSYTLTLNEASSGTGRFFLVSSPQLVANGTTQIGLFTIIPLPQQHKIRISGNIAPSSEVSIYTINGIKICSFVLPGGMENEIPFSPSTNGIYILKLQTGTTAISRKINWVN